jgi:hypothetical protein
MAEEHAAETAAPLSPEERRTLYNKTVREAVLRKLLLESVNFNVDRARLMDAKERSLRLDGQVSKFDIIESSSICVVGVKWRAEIKDGRKVVARCVADYTVVYSGFTEINREVMLIFADNIARSATFAYFRALFSSLDWAAELRLPPLPMFKAFPKV